MSTETTNKKIKIDNGTTFGRTYTDKAVDELLKNASGKLDTVKVTYDAIDAKATADIANKPDGTYVVDIILKVGDTEINVGTKAGLVEIGSLVDIDSGSTFRTISGYGYLDNLMFIQGVGSTTATTIDITGGTLAYIPKSYSINGLVKIQSGGTIASVGLPGQGQSDAFFLVYDTTADNYDWRPVSEIDNKTIPLFGGHRILVPKDSADTGILPCTPSDNGKVLSVVNGEAQWASAGGGSGDDYIVKISTLFTPDEINNLIQEVQVYPENGEIKVLNKSQDVVLEDFNGNIKRIIVDLSEITSKNTDYLIFNCGVNSTTFGETTSSFSWFTGHAEKPCMNIFTLLIEYVDGKYLFRGYRIWHSGYSAFSNS